MRQNSVTKQSSLWDLVARLGQWNATNKGKHDISAYSEPAYSEHSRIKKPIKPIMEEELEAFEVNFAYTTIEVAQLQTKEQKALVLYLTSNKGQDSEIVFWECASPKLKRTALKRAFDPLHLLRRFEEQLAQQVKEQVEATTGQVRACCSTCFSCSLQAAS